MCIRWRSSRLGMTALGSPSAGASRDRRGARPDVAGEVVTERSLSGFDQVAIDGYACEASTCSASPITGGDSDDAGDAGDDAGDQQVSLPVMGTIEAGADAVGCSPSAAHVQTGAPMPTLADVVLPLRWTDGGQSRVRVLRPVRSGAYVRRTGEDVQPVTSPFGPARSSGRRRSGCWPRSVGTSPGASAAAAVGMLSAVNSSMFPARRPRPGL